MSRPIKWRRVCGLPESNSFGPIGIKICKTQKIEMTVDEFECIRLIDYEGLNQEQCAGRMNIARTTVQGIYAEARRKLAQSLVEAKWLVIEGGEYKLCDGLEKPCGKGCRRHLGCQRKIDDK